MRFVNIKLQTFTKAARSTFIALIFFYCNAMNNLTVTEGTLVLFEQNETRKLKEFYGGIDFTQLFSTANDDRYINHICLN